MSFLDLVVQSFLRCTACGESVERGSFPLCFKCHWSLLSGSPILPTLGDPVDSAWAMYSLNDENYEILKSWKKKRGPAFDRVVLKTDVLDSFSEWMDRFSEEPRAFIPIPQNPVRSFQMSGSPARVLACWLSRRFELPIRDLLLKEWQLFAKRQAELDHWYRLINPIPYRFNDEEKDIPRSVVLVDDFITTGHTVREAARALKLGGVRVVGVFGLGARISRHATEEDTNLLKGA